MSCRTDIYSAIIVTTSSKKERLENYLAVGDIELTKDDIKAIDHAGAKGELMAERKAKTLVVGKWVAIAAMVGYIAVRQFRY